MKNPYVKLLRQAQQRKSKPTTTNVKRKPEPVDQLDNRFFGFFADLPERRFDAEMFADVANPKGQKKSNKKK